MAEIIKKVCNDTCPVPHLKEDIEDLKQSNQHLHSKIDLLSVDLKYLGTNVAEIKATYGSMQAKVNTLEVDHVAREDIKDMVTRKGLWYVLGAVTFIFALVQFVRG